MIFSGIDAGGTSIKCVVVNDNGDLLASVKAGHANYKIIGIDKFYQRINEVLEKAKKKSKIDRIDLVGMGIAGAFSKKEIEDLEKRLLTVNSSNTFITIDGEIALYGAFMGKPGIVIVAGTGSIVYGLTSEKEVVRAGGWGPIIGDEGSGYWIGLKGIKAAIRSMENRGEKTKLQKLIKEYFCINNLSGLVDIIYRENIPQKDIAAVAPLVIETAYRNDKVAKKIVVEAVDELIILIKSVLENSNYKYKKIAVIGGIFNHEMIFEMFEEKLDIMGLKTIRPLYSPGWGAIFYALEKARMSIKLRDFIEKIK